MIYYAYYNRTGRPIRVTYGIYKNILVYFDGLYDKLYGEVIMKRTKKNTFTSNERYMLYVAIGLVVVAFMLGCCGPQGDKGDTGVKGDPGLNAPSVYMLPAAFSECPTGGVEVYVGSSETIVCNGNMGATGATGAAGQDGLDGSNGQDGLNGLDATPVTMIKFCPNHVGSYSSSFPEYGIQLGTQIYAVYSSNGGFLTLLIPGTYSTTGIGANCNFTIHADGTITY